MLNTTVTAMMSTKEPAQYSRRVLLAVSGLSPQIVTETLYALATDMHDPYVPTEIHLITTLEGAQRAELSLLSTDMNWFGRLCQDYGLKNISFNRQNIHTLCDTQGRPLEDIRSVADNHAAADFITAQVRALSADPDCALHVSIAGGRKTMGFYLGYALSLHGRPQDRLSHVLVSEPFEGSMDFFYPTPYSRVLQTRSGGLVDTINAEVTLAEIPFVSLRRGLSDSFLSGQATFSETVAAAQASLAAPALQLDRRKSCIIAGPTFVPLPPADMAFLSMFARLAKAGESALPAPLKDFEDQKWADRFMIEYQYIVGKMSNKSAGDTATALKKGMDGQFFSSRKSKLTKHLHAALGVAAPAYCIDDGGTRPRRYRLALPPESIHFIN